MKMKSLIGKRIRKIAATFVFTLLIVFGFSFKALALEFPLYNLDTGVPSSYEVAEINSFEISGSSFSAALKARTIEANNVSIVVNGDFGGWTFDDGERAVLGYCEETGSKTTRLIRLLIREREANVVTMVISIDSVMYSLDINADAINIAQQLPSLFDRVPHLERDAALELYSPSEAPSSTHVLASAFEDEGGAFASGEEAARSAGSYTEYLRFSNNLNSGATIKLSAYDIDKSFITSPGWHHTYSLNGNQPYAFSSNVVPNGSDYLLFQIAFLDIRTVDHHDPTGAATLGEAGMQISYYVGCVGEYIKSTGTCSVKFINTGLAIKGASLSISGLKNQACFTESSGGVKASGKSINLLSLALSPSDILLDIFNNFTGKNSSTETVREIHGGLAQQLAKGKLVRAIAIVHSDGLIKVSGDPNKADYINVGGKIEHAAGNVQNDINFSFKYDCVASI